MNMITGLRGTGLDCAGRHGSFEFLRIVCYLRFEFCQVQVGWLDKIMSGASRDDLMFAILPGIILNIYLMYFQGKYFE
jgi:hypothetical protein